MLRAFRSCRDVDEALSARTYAGDEYVATPQWTWTYGIEIDAPPDAAWPWVARLAYARRKEAGVPVVLHEASRCLCCAGTIALTDREDGDVRLSWTFLVEPHGEAKSRFVSRFRVDYGEGMAARLEKLLRNGKPRAAQEVAIDQHVLLGLKERAESGHETTLRR
jgi:hypothetical protein